ncbi:MAG: hypothetical protein Q4E67_06525 [Planctomycetia bacterium]|nr:hypothetical protein [Planctomycetia bacterium]
MPWIDTTTLPPLPAPVWFILFWKVAGFVFHTIFMHLWLVAFPIAMILHWKGCSQGQQWAGRLIRPMPIYIALGVNLGIVPLLFIQLLYPRAFYPATILMAWHWLLIIPLLIPAYFGVYRYAFALPKETPIPPGTRAWGWGSALFFLLIGFLFVNGLILTARPEVWEEIWLDKEIAAAATGFGSAIREATLFPRWMLMLALGLGTTAIWTLWDRVWLWKNPPEEYVRWSNRFISWAAVFGAFLFLLAGSHYLFMALPDETCSAMLRWPLLPFTLAAAIGPPLCAGAVLYVVRRNSAPTPFQTLLPIGLQLFSLTTNAISRQALQSWELSSFYPLSVMSVQTEISPLLLFLGTLILGLLVLAWMLCRSFPTST